MFAAEPLYVLVVELVTAVPARRVRGLRGFAFYLDLFVFEDVVLWLLGLLLLQLLLY